MRPGILGAVVGAAIALSAVWSCSIDRPSEALKCFSDNDCTQFPGTFCSSGYCITGTRPIDARELDAFVFVCPAACNSGCDMSTTPPTCNITGAGGSIACPAGLKCNITCGASGACGVINCASADSCDIDCLATNACLNISCMTTNCDVTCTGDNACANITCTSGNCTAACSGSNACGGLSCSTGNCTETCSGGNGNPSCGSLSCGTGACARDCSGSAACGSMSCGGGTCTETCAGGALACGPVNAGTGKTTATCMGLDGACDDITCPNACQCDVLCDVGTNTCPGNMTCPDPSGPDLCSDTFGTCDSSVNTNKCRKCI